ncbi:hypothetical protein [Moritella viscosa]|uniref:Uncharacterized protein n=1 Tax=Moritella viscosa TaxID=80854 RepID=A0A1L0ADV4_9GAMM|nr:hypothetical protein [Moritella viscosa]SGZ13262.1 Putative uncharacterized protein [Moritella viscosa]
MPHGKTTIRFTGGSLAGHVEENVTTRLLAERIENQIGMWIRENDDGSAQIMSHGQPDSNWNYFKVEIYEKQERLSDQEPYIYKYVGQEEVSRCESKTKQGNSCKNRTVTDQGKCSQHMENNMSKHELEISKSHLSDSSLFYRCGDQCFAASSKIPIEFEDIKESIIFLHEELLSQDFADGDEQNFIGYAKIFACLKELEFLKSDKNISNQTSK